jgi:predicted transcriptional regulator
MVLTAPKQRAIVEILLKTNRAMTIKEITNSSQLTYNQVASVLVALKAKGYVKKANTGLYEVTDDARLLELSPEAQIEVLKQKVEELELQVQFLQTRLSKK